MIEATSLTKRYGGTLAVDGLSFTVRPGEVTGFVGPNGSGKSTTMRMIVGLDHPTAGTVTVHGRHYRRLPWPLREVGALLEARAVHPGRRAVDHLVMLAQTNSIPRPRVDEVLGIVGLSDVAHKRVGKFSLGMSQRLGIATALLGDPGVLLFDEPVNGLDPEGILWVRNLLKQLAAEGRTVLVSSHLMSEMAVTASRVIVIGRGRLIAEGAVSELVRSVAGRSTLVRTPRPDLLGQALLAAGATLQPQADGSALVSGLTAADIGDLAARLQVPVHELTPQASLEEAFMDLTRTHVQFHTGPDGVPPGGEPAQAPAGSGGRPPMPPGPAPSASHPTGSGTAQP